LANASAQYRYEAVKRLAALKPPLAAADADRLGALALDDPYEEIRAEAVLAPDASDPKGRAGWDRLLVDYAINFWCNPPPKEGWAYNTNRDRTERRHWVNMTLRILGEQGRTRLERDFGVMAKDAVRLRIAIDLATSLRWRIEGLVKAGLEVAQRKPLAATAPWRAQVPINTKNPNTLPYYFAASDAASDPATAEILVGKYKKSWELYPTFARNLKPDQLLAWLEPIALESSQPSSRPRIFNAWKAIGKAALPSIQRVKAAVEARPSEQDRFAAEYAKAIGELAEAMK
jgi:hypothetical protein